LKQIGRTHTAQADHSSRDGNNRRAEASRRDEISRDRQSSPRTGRAARRRAGLVRRAVPPDTGSWNSLGSGAVYQCVWPHRPPATNLHTVGPRKPGRLPV